jgi:hypothetical protein
MLIHWTKTITLKDAECCVLAMCSCSLSKHIGIKIFQAGFIVVLINA